MLRATRACLVFFSLVGLAACAPVLLGRTPTPAAPGTTKLSASASYPVGLTQPPALPENRLFGEPDPAYSPLPSPLSFRVAYGRSETLETNVELMVSPGLSGAVNTGSGGYNLGVRYGVKNRFQKVPIELAYDFGGSLYLTNLGLDAGMLAAVPLGRTKLYGGLRGFGIYSGAPSKLGVAAALTLGGDVPLYESQSVMLELTLLASSYNGVEGLPGPNPPTPQPVGFTLVPAVTVNF